MQTSKIDLAGGVESRSAGVVGSRGTAWFPIGPVLLQV